MNEIKNKIGLEGNKILVSLKTWGLEESDNEIFCKHVYSKCMEQVKKKSLRRLDSLIVLFQRSSFNSHVVFVSIICSRPIDRGTPGDKMGAKTTL